MPTRRLSRAPTGTRRTAVHPQQSLQQQRALRSRELLKEATRAALNERGFRSLRVQDVTARAGLANGLFYRYFQDLGAAVAEVCAAVFDELLHQTRSLTDYSDPYTWIYRSHLAAVGVFARNPGVLACFFGLAADYPEFDVIWKRNAHDWNLQVAGFLQETAGFTQASAERMGFVLGAMTEGVIYQELIRQTEDLVRLGRRPQEIAEVISVMWYRAIFLRDPPIDRLRAPGRKVIGVKKPR
jgi:TetR/AcrR family transcriptional regulator, ethionamide resistance regulator